MLGAHLQCSVLGCACSVLRMCLWSAGSVLGCTCSVLRTCSVLAVYLAVPVVYCECLVECWERTCSVLAVYMAVPVVYCECCGVRGVCLQRGYLWQCSGSALRVYWKRTWSVPATACTDAHRVLRVGLSRFGPPPAKQKAKSTH